MTVWCAWLVLCVWSVAGAYGAEISRPDLPGPIPAELVRVIDGDTIEVRARIWLDLDLTTRVRLAGIDAPELAWLAPAPKSAVWQGWRANGLRRCSAAARSGSPISSATSMAVVSSRRCCSSMGAARRRRCWLQVSPRCGVRPAAGADRRGRRVAPLGTPVRKGADGAARSFAADPENGSLTVRGSLTRRAIALNQSLAT
jgi:hypothetical protein